jgi:sulfate adenylyltransferase
MVTDGAQVNKLIESCQMQIELNDRQLCDVELLMQGGFSPLDSFMSEDDYNSVVQSMRLKSGLLFGLPVVFDTSDPNMTPNKRVLLKSKDIPIAIFDITSRYQPNKVLEAKQCYGTTSIEHPGVWSLVTERGQFYCGGKIIGLNIPHRDFLCRSPTEIRAEIPPNVDVVAFQCRNPIHRAHYELFMKALQDPSLRPHSIVLVHPTCGPTQMDDIPGAVRYRTYEVLKHQVANPLVLWEYLPYSMHMAGPREAIQHMILRKNYGCTHFIIGRDMAGCKSSLDGILSNDYKLIYT